MAKGLRVTLEILLVLLAIALCAGIAKGLAPALPGLAGLLRQRRVEPVEDPMAELPARIDARGTVGRAMAGMTDMQREAIVLHDIEGWSFREMGERLGISLRTAQSRVVSAHRALQRELTEPSGSADESRTP